MPKANIGGTSSFFTQEQIKTLTIDEFIFHVVGGEQPKYFDEVSSGEGMESFFKMLVISAAGGKKCDFTETTAIPAAISSIVEDHKKFVEVSKNLAEGFHIAHTKSASRGVLIFSEFTCSENRYWLLAKYNETKVFRFEEEEKSGRRRAVIQDVSNTFVEDQKALQKAVLFTGSTKNDNVFIFDKTNRKDIAHYLRTWLAVKPHYTDEAATKELYSIIKNAAVKVKDQLSNDIKKTWASRLFDAINKLESLDLSKEEEFSSFMATVFGPDSNLDNLVMEVDKNLKGKQLRGEAFKLKKGNIKKPKRTRIQTYEGVEIFFPNDLEREGLITINQLEDGSEEVTIRSERRIKQDELPD